MLIRAYTDSDLEAVVSCFGRSVREIGARHYAREQVAAWAPDVPDMDGWATRLRTGGVFVAEVESRVAGFVRVEDNGWVDLLYVHPEYERRGVGWNLLWVGCSWAVGRRARTLQSEVSIAARPLFERMGFRVETEQVMERRGVEFRNFRMVRDVSVEQIQAPDRREPASLRPDPDASTIR